MATKAINFKFNGPTTEISTYNAARTNLGTLIKQYSGIGNTNNYAGPARIGMARPLEQSTPIAGAYPHVISYDSNIDWVFLSDNGTAAGTRRIILYEYNKTLSEFNWKGFITLTYPLTTSHTIRGMRVTRDLYTTGTVSTSGTTVTGIGTDFRLIAVGSRIGFGSTNPTQITTWFEIDNIPTSTDITLTTTAGNIPDGPYVIDELRVLTSTTNATLANGGLYVTKGLRIELFTTVGTTIPAATNIDNRRAVYFLADPNNLNNGSTGCTMESMASINEHHVYILDSVGPKIFKFNVRAGLTVVAGRSNDAFTLVTGNQPITGTLQLLNNGRVGTLDHGPGSGEISLYFVTSTRVYRCALTNIITATTRWQSDVMVEVPPGGSSTYPITNVLSSVEIVNNLDRLIIITSGAVGARSYVTRYNTVSNPFDHIFLVDDKQLDHSIADSGGVIHPSIQVSPFSVWSEGGILYMVRLSSSSIVNQLYTLPIGANQSLGIANNQMLITPRFDISDSNMLYNVCVKNIIKLGTDTFSLAPEPFKLYYRTTGIISNTGNWTELDEFGDLSGVIATEIQFMFIFKILGTTCIPARIMGLSLIYEDNTTDSHYEPSVGNSSVVNRIFSYRQSTLWSSVIPNMRIRLYNAVTGVIVLDDNIISSSFGTFQYSNDNGVSWLPWNSNIDVVGNYIRYTATSLPTGIRIRSLLTQA
jgi:hypothetical protein